MKLCGFCGGGMAVLPFLSIGDYAYCDADCAAKHIAKLKSQIAQILAENAALLTGTEMVAAVIEQQNEQLPALAKALNKMLRLVGFLGGAGSPDYTKAQKALAAYRDAPPVVVALPDENAKRELISVADSKK